MVLERPEPLPGGAGRFTFAGVYFVHLPTTARAREMATYYYGTIPVLAWVLNHYFYGGVHYAWLAESFLPPPVNPRSSNPHNIYGELMDAWRHRDRYNQYVRGSRQALLDGVAAKRAMNVLTGATADRLGAVCLNVSVDLFYPVVYRVDVDQVGAGRKRIANSGLEGSREVLIVDLREREFELLFTDNRGDSMFRLMVLDEASGAARTTSAAVLAMLEERCAP